MTSARSATSSAANPETDLQVFATIDEAIAAVDGA